MITPFLDSDFVVTFTGEAADSRVIRGWDRVLSYIDQAVGADHDGWTCRDPEGAPDLHDPDCWTRLDYEAGDNRHLLSIGEFVYCVGLHITRLTTPIDESLLGDQGGTT